MTGSMDHERLLTLAAQAQGAADDGDTARLERHLRSLVHVLVEHLHQFAIVCSRLRPVQAAKLRRGHAAVAASARALLREATGGCAGAPGSCSDRAEVLRALLSLQAREERLTLRVVPVPVETDARVARR